VSPIFGWSQQDSLDHAHRPERTHLWDHLRRSAEEKRAAVEKLGELLARADFEPVTSLLHWLLGAMARARRWWRGWGARRTIRWTS
jgi:ATP-dependent helicase/nuclease subunit A